MRVASRASCFCRQKNQLSIFLPVLINFSPNMLHSCKVAILSYIESSLKALRSSFLIQLKTVFINNDECLESYCQMLGSMTYVASLKYLNEKSFLKKDFRKET